MFHRINSNNIGRENREGGKFGRIAENKALHHRNSGRRPKMSSLQAEHLATNHRGHLATRASGQDRVNQYMSRVPTKGHRMA